MRPSLNVKVSLEPLVGIHPSSYSGSGGSTILGLGSATTYGGVIIDYAEASTAEISTFIAPFPLGDGLLKDF